MQRMPSMRDHDGRAGAASSSTSSTTSSPLSDTGAPTRSWVSIVAPRHNEAEVTGESTHKRPEGEQVGGNQDDANTESAETVRPKRKRKHRKGTHAIRKVCSKIHLMDAWSAVLTVLWLVSRKRRRGCWRRWRFCSRKWRRSRSERLIRPSRWIDSCASRAARFCEKVLRETWRRSAERCQLCRTTHCAYVSAELVCR